MNLRDSWEGLDTMKFERLCSYIPAALAVAILLFFSTMFHFDITGDFHGLYLLKCDRSRLFDIADDIFLGDEDRLICKLEFEPVKEFIRPWKISELYYYRDKPDLLYEWSSKTGHGYIFSRFPDKRMLLVTFSRYRDENGAVPKGLFVGGGLPFSKHMDMDVTMNETGIAFHDGSKWQHLWCSVNEGIVSVMSPENIVSPAEWKFLGSKVLEKSREKLIIRSRHEVSIDGVPLEIDRYVFFRAGDAYFILAFIVKNIGDSAVHYYYIYGDEPWVGDYGTSIGDVGWVKDRLFLYEGAVDTRRYSFAGMYDAGNPAVPTERGLVFSGRANFIEWLGDNRPELVYFSNTIGTFAPESQRVPLSNDTSRVIFLEWGPKYLKPGQSHTYLLALGMASHYPVTGFPVKPDVVLSDKDMAYLSR